LVYKPKKLKNSNREKFAKAVSNVKEPRPQSQIYQDIYQCNNDVARSRSSILMRSTDVKERISELLDEQGLSITVLNTKLNKLINAKKEVLNAKGEVVQLNDNPASLNALQTAYKLHKVIGSDGINIDARTLNVSSDNKQTDHLASVGGSDLSHILSNIRAMNKELLLKDNSTIGEIGSNTIDV